MFNAALSRTLRRSNSVIPFRRLLTENGNSSGEETKSRLMVPDLHEPAYLEDLKPKVGYYELLDLQLKGYDFVVLEKYQSYVHKTMQKMKFNVTKTWSAPHEELQIDTLLDFSTGIRDSCKIKIYERNIQTKDALVTRLPVLIDVIIMTSPPGVSFNIRAADPNNNAIYFRDSVLDKLKNDLQELKDTPLIGVA